MKLYQFFGLEIDLIPDYELLGAIEVSTQLPIPEEQSIFSVKSPATWLRAGQGVRQAFRDELPYRMTEFESAFFLHVVQENAEGFSDLLVEGDQSEELEDFWYGTWIQRLWQHLGVEPGLSDFRGLKGEDPFGFVYLSYDKLLELDLPDWERWLEEWQAEQPDLPEWPARWLAELIENLEEAQLAAAEQPGTPSLFIYPIIFPELTYEVEEDEEPQPTVRRALQWLEQVENGQEATTKLDPFLQYQLLRYLELKLQRLQQGITTLNKEELESLHQADPRSQTFAESHALPDFLGEPKEMILALWELFQRGN